MKRAYVECRYCGHRWKISFFSEIRDVGPCLRCKEPKQFKIIPMIDTYAEDLTKVPEEEEMPQFDKIVDSYF